MLIRHRDPSDPIWLNGPRHAKKLNKDTKDIGVQTQHSSRASHVNEDAEEVGASTYHSLGRKRKATFEDAEDVKVSECERKVH